MGVELLMTVTLAAGVTAAVVALVVSIIQSSELAAVERSRAELVARSIAGEYASAPEESTVEEAAAPFLMSGVISGARLVDSLETPSLHGGGWILAPVPDGRLVAVSVPGRGAFAAVLPSALALLAAGMLVLALLTPGYLNRNVTGPLRGILEEADRQIPGSGETALAARRSFLELVGLLSERDRELARLRQMAEQRADEAEEQAAAVVSGIRSAVLGFSPDRRLSLYNPGASELFALEPGDLGMPFPSGRTLQGRLLSEILEGGGGKGENSFQIESPDGEPRSFSVSSTVSGSGTAAVLVSDTTRLRTLERRLAEEEAMAGVGALSSGVAHEMGNTLCALRGFIDLLARGHSDPRTEGILAEAGAEIESAQRMISSFKSLAGSQDSVKSRMGCRDLADTAEAAARDGGAAYSMTGLRPDGHVRADQTLVQRCISNLLRNAREAAPDSRPDVELCCTGDAVEIRVSDHGPGLGEDSDILMRPFYTTKQGQGHMGMGLTITRRLVFMMNGRLSARSRDGGGAVFTISLPLYGDEDRS
jgi:signal transduction histidine kinase